jgi:hypothetical protein
MDDITDISMEDAEELTYQPFPSIKAAEDWEKINALSVERTRISAKKTSDDAPLNFTRYRERIAK